MSDKLDACEMEPWFGEEILARFGLVLTDDPEFDHDEQSFGQARDAFVAALRLRGDSVMVPRADALAQALCLLDTFAGEGLTHTYGNGQVLDAADVCTELAEAYGIECEPGWWRTVANRAASPTGGE